jgi:hypothetical protein
MDFSSSNQEPVAAVVLEEAVRSPRWGGLMGLDQQVKPASQVGQTVSGVKDQKMLRPECPVGNGGKDHVKHNGKKPKLTFAELLAKYQKDNEAKRTDRTNDVKYSRFPRRHNYGNWNQQRKGFHSATTYYPFEPSMPVSYAPYPTSDHPYSSWGWSDSWTHTPSYFRPYHVEYATPRRPSRASQPYVEIDCFEYKICLVLKTRKRLSRKYIK